MIIETDNNILTSLPDHSVVIHPVNCFGELQPGLGQAINRKYPNWYKDYKGYCSWFLKSEWSDKSHTDEILGTFHRHQPDDNTIICSVFVQERFGRRGYAPDLDLWDRALNRIELQTRRVQRVTG